MKRIEWGRDLRWARAVIWGVAAANAIVAGHFLWTHQWWNAFASTVCTVNLLIWLRLSRSVQQTRDRLRIVQAEQKALIRELDRL